MRIVAILLVLSLASVTPAAAEIDYSKLTFPQDAQQLISEPGAYNDALEFIDDKVQAAVKRLYAASFIATIIESCSGEGFWANLKKLPTTAGVYLDEIRADKELDAALPQARHLRETLKHGARGLGRADAAALVAQGICKRINP